MTKQLERSKSIILNVLLGEAAQQGYSAFTLEIIEYSEEATSREQYYIDLFKPEYNILKTAGSRLGFWGDDR